MKANEFVKKHGWDSVKEQIKQPTGIYGAAFDYAFMSDLKRLAESHELVESFNGLEMAKKFYDENIIECSDAWNLKQAIADVESCQ